MSYMESMFARCDEDGKLNKRGGYYQLQNITLVTQGKSLSTQSMSSEILNSKLSGIRRPTIGRTGNWRPVVVMPDHIANAVCTWVFNATVGDDGLLRYMDMGLREFLLRLYND